MKRAGLLLVACASISCVPAALNLPPRPASLALAPSEAEARRDAVEQSFPAGFTMVHQVSIAAAGQTWLVLGHLVGRKDGAFRVTAMGGMGPRLFEVSRVSGRWQTRLLLDALAGRLDPIHVGRAVARIYFTVAGGPLAAERGYWVARSAIDGDDEVDQVEDWRDPDTLLPVLRRFTRRGATVLEIAFEGAAALGGHDFARTVRLSDRRGLQLALRVTHLEANGAVDDAALEVNPAAPSPTPPRTP